MIQIKNNIKSVLLIVLVAGIYTCIYTFDRKEAYYGMSLFEHHVLPFDLHVISTWSHEDSCTLYSLGSYRGEAYSGTQYITINNSPSKRNEHICMKTIISYGFKENEIIVHWLSVDSCEYYIRIDAADDSGLFNITPKQLITKDKINEYEYMWIELTK